MADSATGADSNLVTPCFQQLSCGTLVPQLPFSLFNRWIMKQQLWVFLLMLPVAAWSQVPVSDSTTPTKKLPYSYAGFTTSYSSNMVFAGRKDSVTVPYFTPGVFYQHKTGLFASASVSFLTNAPSQALDLTTVTGGYRYGSEKVAAGAELTRYFFSKTSYNVQSAMTGYGAVYAGYNLANVVTVYGDAILSFGSSNDFFTGFELSHPFYLWNDRVQFTPTFYSFWGTQRYYNNYYSERRYSVQRPSGGGNGPGYGGGSAGSVVTTSSILEETAAFRSLSLEWSAPVVLVLSRWKITFNTVYVLPQSPSVLTVNGVAQKEHLVPVFYWSLGVRYQTGKW